MLGSYWSVVPLHLIGTALILKFLNLILPCCITGYYTCAANFLLYMIVARFTFVWTKRKFLGDRIQPEDKAVLVTGCDSGFGHALVKRLDAEGYTVFASCLFPDGPGADDLRQSCSKGRMRVLPLDVTSDDSVAHALQFVKDNLGTAELWAVVNNAGVHKGVAAELTHMQDYADCMAVNALGVVRVTKAFLPMIRQSRGRVVNLTSIGGRVQGPYFTPYLMSKYAAVAFNDCLRQEMDVWGVKVISVEPEVFNTPMFNGQRLAERIAISSTNIDEDLQADYGRDYLKKMQLSAEFNFRIACDKIHLVADALYDAISAEHPDIRYQPARNIAVKMFLYVYMMWTPFCVQDMCIKALLYIYGVPKPAGAVNSS